MGSPFFSSSVVGSSSASERSSRSSRKSSVSVLIFVCCGRAGLVLSLLVGRY